ncbi:MAG: hypothetical protein Q8K82_02735 [Gemmatimonadaceae bacterium]|nr:hypothetical protein [Gemmatimonadaceae bacterium]
MIFLTGTRRLVVAGFVAALASACVDGPSAATEATYVDPLAETFDALARESSGQGDLARGDGFSHAALAVRHGVAPSRLEVRNGAQTEVFDAFVTAVEWESTLPASVRPPTRRSLVAWRRTTDATMRVLSVLTPTDSALILSPLALGAAVSTPFVYTGASAMFHEGKDGPQGRPDLTSVWYGTSGWVKIRETQSLGRCVGGASASSASAGVKCEQARYLARFDVSMQRLTGRPAQVVSGTTARRVVTTAETAVNGLKLKFACIVPMSDKGCR